MNNGGKNHNKPSPKSLYVCMSVCLYVCMHACMHVCTQPNRLLNPFRVGLTLVTLVEVCSAVPWFSMQISNY